MPMSNPPNLYSLTITPSNPAFGLAASSFTSMLLNTTKSTPAGFSTAGFPGFAPPDPGTFATYRRISAHPTVALAMRIVTAPIVANTWGWSKHPDAPQEWLTFARHALHPMRTSILTAALKALAFGFSAFEKVWQTDGSRITLARLKPLLPELTQILVDPSGNFAGFRQPFADGAPIDIPREKSFLYTYDGECGNLYGRSRHENVRVTWSQSQQTAERLAQYQKKVAGVIAQLHYPEGVSRDAAGVERSNDWIAQQILEAVSMGRSVRFPNLFASMDDPRAAADLAGKSQWVLSQFDPGGTDHSPGLLAALAYYDKLLFRGWLRPERVGLEAQHGTRADATEHSETSIVDSELVDRDFAAAFNSNVLDDLLTLNFGPQAKGAVWVDPSPISDTKTTTARAVLASLLNHPQSATPIIDQIDTKGILADLDIPMR